MKTHSSLLGSWVSYRENIQPSDETIDCIWHVIDDRTCAYEQRTDHGLMVSWFQYWTDGDGILRYPLSKTTRSTFKIAEHVPINFESDHIIMNGYKFEPVTEFPIPERQDLFPGTRPDENGLSVPHVFKGKLQEYLRDPPQNIEANKPDMATPNQPPD